MLNIVYLLKEVEMPEKIGLWHGKVITVYVVTSDM